MFPYQLSMLLLSLLTGCTQDKFDKLLVESFSRDTFLQHENISGKWYYSFPFYSSELTLLQNGTFQFFEQGCMAKGYSEGKWYRLGNEITLQSFEKFNKAKEALTGIANFNDVVSPNLLNVFPDTVNVYFTIERLIVDNRTLTKANEYGSNKKTIFRRDNNYYFEPILHQPTLPDSSAFVSRQKSHQ